MIMNTLEHIREVLLAIVHIASLKKRMRCTEPTTNRSGPSGDEKSRVKYL